MPSGRGGQVVEDRTVRPLIAVAVVHEVLERAAHLLQLGNPPVEIDDVLLRDLATSALARRRFCHRPSRRSISFMEKPRSRARRMNRSVWTSVSS